MVTVPVEGLPPTTEVGLSDIAETVGAVTVRVAVFVVPLEVAVIVLTVFAETAIDVTVKVAVVAPAATVTLEGRVVAVVLSLSEIARPPVGAAEAMVTVPVEDAPPTTLVGETLTDVSAGGLMVSVAVFVSLSPVTVIVAVVTAETPVVVTVKVPVDEPAATVTLEGTVADAELLETERVEPAAGAGPLRVTVPVEDVPPVTLVGERATDDRSSGVTVRVAVLLPLRVAVIVAVAVEETAMVVMVKVAVVAPCATVTLEGTVAAALLLLRVTALPPEGAAVEMVTVPVELVPAITEVGETLTDEIDCPRARIGMKIARTRNTKNLWIESVRRKLGASMVGRPQRSSCVPLGPGFNSVPVPRVTTSCRRKLALVRTPFP